MYFIIDYNKAAYTNVAVKLIFTTF